MVSIVEGREEYHTFSREWSDPKEKEKNFVAPCLLHASSCLVPACPWCLAAFLQWDLTVFIILMASPQGMRHLYHMLCKSITSWFYLVFNFYLTSCKYTCYCYWAVYIMHCMLRSPIVTAHVSPQVSSSLVTNVLAQTGIRQPPWMF